MEALLDLGNGQFVHMHDVTVEGTIQGSRNLYAGTVNDIWAILIPADFLILAIGCAFIILGVITLRRQMYIVSS